MWLHLRFIRRYKQFENYLIGVYCVDYGNKSNKFAFGGGEGVVYICSLTNSKWWINNNIYKIMDP